MKSVRRFLFAHAEYGAMFLRLSLAFVFFLFSREKFIMPQLIVQQIQASFFAPVLNIIPLSPVIVVQGIGVAEAAVAASMLLGFWLRFGTLLGIALLVPILLIAQVRQDVVVLAACLALLFTGAGAWSIDALLLKKRGV